MKNHETPQAVEAVARAVTPGAWARKDAGWSGYALDADIAGSLAIARRVMAAITTPPPASRPEAVDRLTRVGTAQSGDDRMFTVQDAEAICAYISSLEAPPASNEHAELIEKLIVRFSDMAICRLDIDEDSLVLAKICGDLRHEAADALQALSVASPSHLDPEINAHIFAWFNNHDCDEMARCLAAFNDVRTTLDQG